MLKIIKIFKKNHKHKWHTLDTAINESLFAEGWDYWLECRCGAIKRKYMYKKEEIIESEFNL